MIVLNYERGGIVARGGSIPHGKYDAREGVHRALAFRYREVVEHLEQRGVEYRDEAKDRLPLPTLSSNIKLRDYQLKALDAWVAAGRRGVIVLPTGAGKTFIALKAIEALQVATLVVAPTLVLVDQWRRHLEDTFGVEVGVIRGGIHTLKGLTVATYASASLRANQFGNRFELLILDEVHHLPAPQYRNIGLMYLAPYRLGLTATLEREDGGHIALMDLVGGKVYEREVDDLAGVHLSDYTVETVSVPLTEEEQAEYVSQFAIYRNFIRSRRIRMRSTRDYQRFVMRSGSDQAARRALLARNRAMDIALNSSAKVEHMKRLLLENPGEKTIIFTRHNNLVYKISREMLVPAITHQTPTEERRETLRGFKQGRYMRIVTSRVLDEGVDVPDASLAIILSGTGSSREFTQRLGRILRKKEGKQARLVELISKGTAETRMSRRRRAS